jgi:excisionase family DNA binding protein
MTPEPKPQRKFCTTREAAELLGISLKTAQLWSESGLLEAWRTEGGHRRIYRDSVSRLLLGGGVAKPADTESAALPSEAFRILVAEDDETLRKLYTFRLRIWPLAPQVTVAPSGIAALLEIGRRPPDLLITDLKMPEMDGFRMLQTLRQMPELASMKIVIVTGLDKEEISANGGLPEGIQVFPKPIPFDKLEQLAEQFAAAKTGTKKGVA